MCLSAFPRPVVAELYSVLSAEAFGRRRGVMQAGRDGIYISAWALLLSVQTNWAISGPQSVERATGTDLPRFFVSMHISTSKQKNTWGLKGDCRPAQKTSRYEEILICCGYGRTFPVRTGTKHRCAHGHPPARRPDPRMDGCGCFH